jgi:hypothetical protein
MVDKRIANHEQTLSKGPAWCQNFVKNRQEVEAQMDLIAKFVFQN